MDDPRRESAARADVRGQRRLLEALQRDGPLGAEALASRLGLSRTAVARQLRMLGDQGLVSRREVRHGAGRPRHLYDITPEAQSSRPRDDRAAVELLDAAREIGGDELLARLFEARRRGELASIRSRLESDGLKDRPLADRVRTLAAVQDERGYLATVSGERGLRLIEHACPVIELARRTPIVCDAELRLVGQALGAVVERESNIATGGRTCTYRIRARAAGFPVTVWTSGQMRGAPYSETPVDEEPPTPWTGAQWAGRPGHTK